MTESEDNGAHEPATPVDTPPTGNDRSAFARWSQRIWLRIWHNQTNWTLVFAFVGAAGVVWQGFATNRQLALTDRNVAAVERNLPRSWFFATLDPAATRFFPLPDDPAQIGKKGFQFEILLTVHNYGKVPGQIVSLSAKAYVPEAGAIAPPPLGPDGLATVGYRTRDGNLGAFSTEIIPGDGATSPGWLLFAFHDMNYVLAAFGTFRAWLLITIVYRDPFGETRETSNFIDLFRPFSPNIISDPRFTYWR